MYNYNGPIPYALSGFFREGGAVNTKAVMEVMPDKFSMTPEEFAFRAASTMKLPEEFISYYLKELKLDTLIVVNRISEDTVIDNIEWIARSMIEELTRYDDEDQTISNQIFIHEYDSRVYDTLFNRIFEIVNDEVGEDPRVVVDFYMAINPYMDGNVDKFSKDFIILHTEELSGFSLMNAALTRGDFTVSEVIERLADVSYHSLSGILAKFDELDVDDYGNKAYDDVCTLQREQFVQDVYIAKLKADRLKD